MTRILLLLSLLAPQLALAQPFVGVPPVRVTVAPPAPRVEVQTVRPSPQHVWIGGHWAWRNNAHAWVPGHWALAPSPGYVWEPARWVNQGGAYTYYEGHWRANEVAAPTVAYEPAPAPAQPVEVVEAPPQDIVEVRPAVPFAGAVWMPGYWHWHGNRHFWVAGRWSAPRAGYGWEPHRWERMPNGRFRWAPGHWRHL